MHQRAQRVTVWRVHVYQLRVAEEALWAEMFGVREHLGVSRHGKHRVDNNLLQLTFISGGGRPACSRDRLRALPAGGVAVSKPK